MNHDQLSFLNPNYFHGYHPFDLRSYFESDPFFEKGKDKGKDKNKRIRIRFLRADQAKNQG